MISFRKALRWFFALGGFALGLATAISAFAARMMIAPIRQQARMPSTGRDLKFEEVQFPAQDGLRVSGWFFPTRQGADGERPTVILVHGWQWNRLGYTADNLFSNVTGTKSIDLLNQIRDLGERGLNVLTFDLRNHGQSAESHPMTFGQSEAKDLLGALAYLAGRDDVDAGRIGVMGFSIGANAILFALPQTNLVKAAVAIQPMTPALFTRRMAENLFGVFGMLIDFLSRLFYQLSGGPRLAGIVPAFAASGSGNVPVLYVQGTGDAWGSVEDVSVMADMTPGTQQLLFVNSQHRFGGYSYVVDHAAIAGRFFGEHLM